MINILFLVLCLLTSSTLHRVDGMQSTSKEDLELERQLKLINKPPIKSIYTKLGYIVDCIDIHKQPTFDHPLLRNHKLQRKPSFQKIIGKTSLKNSPIKPIFGLEKDECPIGTIPIRRTMKDDLVRAKSLLNNHVLTLVSPGSHVAQVTLKKIPNMPYSGVSGINSIYNPRVKKDQSSASLMWVRNGPIDGTNKIVVGWHVAPQLYNDDATYVYAVWTTDNFKKTGCYNLQCLGFIQTSKRNYLGERLDNTSVYGGDMVEIRLSILQDPTTNHWWLNMDNEYIGYFPEFLFSDMATADQVGWGGRTTTSEGTPSPQMGSGYFPDNNLLHACYFKDIVYQDKYMKYHGPKKDMTQTFTDKSDCFGVEYYGDQGGMVQYFLQFGGPGGNCGN